MRTGPRLWLASLASLPLLVAPPSNAMDGELQEVNVVASRYRFEPSVLEARVGTRLRIVLSSADVEHGFAVPELGLSVRIPAGGEPVAVEFHAGRPGRYAFGCSEYCGAGHGDMQGEIVVHGAEGSPAAPPPPAAEGGTFGEGDVSVVNLPTTLALERRRFAFRVTHRFARPLGDGSFGDLLEDFLGLDGGAQIGLELRYGLLATNQLGVYRTSDRTILLFDQQRLLDPGSRMPGVDLVLGVEGRDNFREEYSPNLGVVVSKRLFGRLHLYAVPRFVGGTRLDGQRDDEGSDHTLVLGLGSRLYLTPSVALALEASPRLAGFDGRPGDGGNAAHVSFGIEKLVGGHAFQLNFANDIGTTPAQIARGRQGPDDWFIGFNISRRF